MFAEQAPNTAAAFCTRAALALVFAEAHATTQPATAPHPPVVAVFQALALETARVRGAVLARALDTRVCSRKNRKER